MPDRLVLVFMIDALGFVEAGDPAFLPALDRPRAPVRSVLGYSSAAIPTILSGRLPQAHGHFSMYRRDRGDGVFRSLGPWLSLASRLTERRWRLGRWITQYLRSRGVTGYFSLYEIPLGWLRWFDLCQRRDLYAPGAFDGMPGIADRLAQGGPYKVWNWRVPEEQAFREMEAEVERGRKRVLFLYTAELDTVMHATGPGSAETREKLAGYARRIEGIVRRAEKRGMEPRVFVFGDHGMAPVTRTHDLWTALSSMDHSVPDELLYFLDSTMARFWFGSPKVRAEVERVLGTLDCGRLLTDAELRELGAFFPKRDYGDAIFLLNEGEILVPSFMARRPVRGMHGYHPDARHSFTTLLTNVHDRPYPADLVGLHDLLKTEIAEAGA